MLTHVASSMFYIFLWMVLTNTISFLFICMKSSLHFKCCATYTIICFAACDCRCDCFHVFVNNTGILSTKNILMFTFFIFWTVARKYSKIHFHMIDQYNVDDVFIFLFIHFTLRISSTKKGRRLFFFSLSFYDFLGFL